MENECRRFQKAGGTGEVVLSGFHYLTRKNIIMNKFGVNWTEQKIEIVVDYAKTYLTIMNKYPQFQTLYFDGFAGSGVIFKDNRIDIDFHYCPTKIGLKNAVTLYC